MLQDTLEAMLDNRLTADVRPHTVIPIPLSTLKQVWSRVPVSTHPFTTELCTAAAIWQPLLPFSISHPPPALDNIVRYRVVTKLLRHMIGTVNALCYRVLSVDVFKQNIWLLISTRRSYSFSDVQLTWSQVSSTYAPKLSAHLL